MRRLIAIAVLVTLSVAVTAAAAARPIVPVSVRAQIKRQMPAFAYAPTRMAVGFRYASWRRSPQNVSISFTNRAGWEITFVALPSTGACRAGMEASFQLDGNKVYWSHNGAEQEAWRCVTGANGRAVRLVASSPQPPTLFANVGLGLVVASGARIR